MIDTLSMYEELVDDKQLLESFTFLGFASLLDEVSARRTCPTLRNFRYGIVEDFSRIFTHTTPLFTVDGRANWETGEVASCAAFYNPKKTLLVAAFELDKAEWPELLAREHEFRFWWVPYRDIDTHQEGVGLMCCENDDKTYRKRRFASAAEFNKTILAYTRGRVWRTDIYPCRSYLKMCLRAAENAGVEFLENFLENSYLADRVTPLSKYDGPFSHKTEIRRRWRS